MFGLSSLYMKLIGGAVALLVLAGLVVGLKHYKSLAESRGETIATICAVTRTASGQPKLKCGEVPTQIQFMGQAIGTLDGVLHKQNDAVAALGAETVAQQKLSAKASQVAQERARGAEATATRLTASSRSGEPQAKPCAPSKALIEAWR